MNPRALAPAAAAALDRLGVGAADSFLVVSNPETAAVADALVDAAHARGFRVERSEFPAASRDGEEPPRTVANAILAATAVAMVTQRSLSHTRARQRATLAGVRIASLPGIGDELFARLLPIDYAQVEIVGRRLAARLSKASRCRATAAGGSDIELRLLGREAICDDGDLRHAGAFGNLPAGEAYIAPLEDSASGTIVLDGSLAGFGLLGEPLALEVRDGRLVRATGGPAAAWLLATLDAGGRNGRTLAELGIGTNPAAQITGTILEDEKAEGAVHFAFGTNTGMGGANQAAVHIDGLVRDATITLDGETLRRGV